MRVRLDSPRPGLAESLPGVQKPPLARGKARAEMKIEAIQLDSSIQCRATIDTATVTEYAERMDAGDAFPPVVLFGTAEKCWIGDGWHRVFAARQLGLVEIGSDLRKGGRAEALKFALGANAANGLRRTNADKRRCVEIALAEFGGMSDNAIAQMCGVSDKTVKSLRPDSFGNSEPESRTGADGKQYPATRKPRFQNPQQEEGEYEKTEKPEKPLKPIGPPRDGMQFARIAIMNLEQIKQNDLERKQAFQAVTQWIVKHED
jgi:hypothetical protein